MKTKKVILIVVLCIVVLLIAIWGIREYVLWNDGKLQKDCFVPAVRAKG